MTHKIKQYIKRSFHRKVVRDVPAIWRIFNAPGPTPILIYQMGKVGSTSLYAMCARARSDVPLFTVNRIRPGNNMELHNTKDCLFQSFCVWHIKKTFLPLWQYYLRNQIRKKLAHSEVKFISIVRDPVVRNVSGFCQYVELYLDHLIFRYQQKQIDIESVKSIFFRQYKHDMPLRWFDYEFRYVTGIDVFVEKFPQTKGFVRYHNDNVSALVIKLEYLNSPETVAAICDFIGAEEKECEMPRIHVTAQKDNQADFYMDLRNEITQDIDYMDWMYNSKFAKHFYSQEELSQFRLRNTRATARSDYSDQ